MKLALLAATMFALVGCAADDESTSVESAVTTTSANEPTFAPGFSPTGPPKCPYAGGCEGDVHPSSGQLTVDGATCTSDATLHLDPGGPDVQNLTWTLEVTGSCGTYALEGPHFEKYPATGTVRAGNAEAAANAIVESGPVNHVPRKVVASARIDGKNIGFSFYFGDEKGTGN